MILYAVLSPIPFKSISSSSDAVLIFIMRNSDSVTVSVSTVVCTFSDVEVLADVTVWVAVVVLANLCDVSALEDEFIETAVVVSVIVAVLFTVMTISSCGSWSIVYRDIKNADSITPAIIVIIFILFIFDY
jgi:hypothetical protein